MTDYQIPATPAARLAEMPEYVWIISGGHKTWARVIGRALSHPSIMRPNGTTIPVTRERLIQAKATQQPIDIS